MATEVLLMADAKELGGEGDVVTVADGYARNYLLPRKLAAPVTDGTRRRLAKLQKEREAERQQAIEEAKIVAEKLDGLSCTIAVKTVPTRIASTGFSICCMMSRNGSQVRSGCAASLMVCMPRKRRPRPSRAEP